MGSLIGINRKIYPTGKKIQIVWTIFLILNFSERDKSNSSLHASSSSQLQAWNTASGSSAWDSWTGLVRYCYEGKTCTKCSSRALWPALHLILIIWPRAFKMDSKALSKRKADCSTLSAKEIEAFFWSRIAADHMVKRSKRHLQQSTSTSEASFAGSW